MDSDKAVGADFEKSSVVTQFTLQVVKAGTGTGTVTSSPSGISCGTVCVNTFNAGTDIVLTMSPDSGASVTDVAIDGTSIGGVYMVELSNLSGNHTVQVTFGQ